MPNSNENITNEQVELLISLNEKIESTGARQISLLDSTAFLRLAKDLKISDISPLDKSLHKFWQLGFINADLVISQKKLELNGLKLFQESNGDYYYSDCRTLQYKKNGYGNAFVDIELIEEIELFFHPFRCYVLHHIDKIFDVHISTKQYLLFTDGFQKLINECHIKSLDDFTSTHKFVELFSFWNNLALGAVVMEPFVHSIIYKKLIITHGMTSESTVEAIQRLDENCVRLIKNIGKELLTKYRKRICRDAEMIDENYYLHNIIKLMDYQFKKRIKGNIAAAVLLKEMVEVYRRSVERVFDIKLLEEDESGLGIPSKTYKLNICGSKRLFDGDRLVVNQYLRHLGLDYSVRVNVYVEGETEYYALNTAFKNDSYVNFINLKGAFVEKKGKGLAFRESLRNDLKAKIFSIIVFDSDVDDNLRVVKKAANDEDIVGRFFISNPDFEFENFSLEQLVDISLNIAHNNKISIKKQCLLNIVKDCKSGKEFQANIHSSYPDLGRLIKGEEWGIGMYEYVNNENVHGNIPFLEILQTIYSCRTATYEGTKNNHWLNPDTGKMEKISQ